MPPADQDEKFVVHTPTLPIELPPREGEVFAVVMINGSQCKVMKDDLVLANYLQDYDINDQVIFDGVLLVGSKDFTMVGRPYVRSAKVIATVEEQTELEKVLVFKKRRRTSYQKNMQFSHKVTVLRINEIELDVSDRLLAKAVAL